MSIAQHIRRLGFRRWHERQLIEAHASLVTAFLAMIVVAVCLDQFRWRESGFKPLIMLALIITGVALCFKAVTFYFKVLFRAEHYAAQAVCGKCKTYGAIEVITAAPSAADSFADDAGNTWLKVRCKKCGNDWSLTDEAATSPAGKPM